MFLFGSGGRCPFAFPQNPTVSRPSCPPAVRARRARRSPADSWIGSWKPGRPLLRPGAPRQRKGGRSSCLVLFSFNPACQGLARSREPWLSQATPAPALGPRPAAPSGPDSSLRAPGRPARTLRCWRRELRASLPGPRTRGAQESGPLPAEPRSSELRTGAPIRLSVHPGGRSQRARRGPFICNTEESAFQPSPAPTHSCTHTHPGAGRVAHLSPKSC